MRNLRAAQTGFTLMELLVVIAIAAVLTGLALPSFRTMIENAQRREAATAFYSDLQRARSEAIARNASVLVCVRKRTPVSPPSCAADGDTGWQNGWLVYLAATPDVVLQVHDPLADGFTLGGVASPLTFQSTGRVNTKSDYLLCKGSGDAAPRTLSVSRSGSISLELAGTCA